MSTFKIDDAILKNEHLNMRIFDSPDEVWLTFVVACRGGKTHDYDIVYDPVANDRIYATITLFESGVLTAAATIAQLRVKEYFNQMPFHSERAIRELQYLGS